MDTARLNRTSVAHLVVDVPDAPDILEEFSSAGQRIKPVQAVLIFRAVSGAWNFTSVEIKGPKYKSNGSLTVGHRSSVYMAPLDEVKTPHWVRRLVNDWSARMDWSDKA